MEEKDQQELQKILSALAKAEAGDFDLRFAERVSGPLFPLAQRLVPVLDKVVELQSRITAHQTLQAEFIRNINHKLRTPLTSIIGFSALLERSVEEIEKGEVSRYTGIIRRESEKMLGIVETLLDLARIDAGEVDIVPCFFDLNRMITDLCANLERSGKTKGKKVTLDLDQRLEGIIGDPTLIQRALGSLAESALEHTPEGGEVSVTTWIEGEQALVTVRDQGIGIPADKLNLLFQDFARSDQPADKQGMGIDLSLIRSIIWLHGGSIDVASEPDNGSSFTLSLPLQRHLEPAPAEVEEDNGELSILIVDDDESAVTLLSGMLEDYAKLSTARNGDEAVKQWQKRRPDLVLMDLVMPEMDGFEAIRAIRAEEDPKAPTPIIAVSALTDRDEVVRAFSAGADSFIFKPFRRDEVFEAITTRLGGDPFASGEEG